MFNDYGLGIPTYYDHINVQNSQIQPSTVHCSNTGLQWYFQRYLLQRIISVYKWKLPESWAENYFEYVLYCWGYISVFETDKFGVIPQACGLMGYDVMYQPTNAVISNPLLNHDVDMLMNGPYPYELKQRISSNKGHLSNADCAELASLLAQNGTKNIMLAHLSEENNDPELAYGEALSAIADPSVSLRVASQYEPIWLLGESDKN